MEKLHTLHRKTHMPAGAVEREQAGTVHRAQREKVEQEWLGKPPKGLGKFGGMWLKGPFPLCPQ